MFKFLRKYNKWILAVGGTLVFMEGKTKPGKVLDAFQEQAISTSFLPPTLIYMMMPEIEQEPRRFDRLRLLIYGAAIMPPEKIRQARTLFGPVIATNYGLTEAPQIITALTPEEGIDESTIASVGRPGFMTRVGIVDSAGALLPAGEQGEIVVSGDLLMSGYLDNPEQTAEAMVDGRLHTGDVGYLDERGFLFLKDRLKDVIISGGFNVYPSDVEAALAAGYAPTPECVENLEVGAMGIHYVNGALVGDPAVNADQPEALLYLPDGDDLVLVGVEWIVVDADGENLANLTNNPASDSNPRWAPRTE